MGPTRRIRKLWHESLRPWWHDYEWPVVGAVAVAVVALGFVGFRLQTLAENRTPYFWDMLFQSCQLFVLQISVGSPMPWQLNAGPLARAAGRRLHGGAGSRRTVRR